jgi:hypothetical protein
MPQTWTLRLTLNAAALAAAASSPTLLFKFRPFVTLRLLLVCVFIRTEISGFELSDLNKNDQILKTKNRLDSENGFWNRERVSRCSATHLPWRA